MPEADALAPLAAACAETPGREALQHAVAALVEIFRVSVHEVAIFRVEHEVLAFVVPERLQSLGSIPLSAANSSTAARTALTGRADLNNRFALTPHASVFEGVKLGEATMPIQKLVSAPVVRDAKTVGVVQISRKGRSAAEVADFRPEDLARLVQAGRLLEKLL